MNVLSDSGVYTIFFVLNPFIGPALAVYIMNWIIGGKAAWYNIKKRLIKVDWKWYLFILLGIPAFLFLGMTIFNGALPSFQGLSSSFFIGYPISFIVIFFFGGPLAEEIGWRGVALPRMQSRYGHLRHPKSLELCGPFGICRISLHLLKGVGLKLIYLYFILIYQFL